MRKPSLTLGIALACFWFFSTSAQSRYTFKERRADRNFDQSSFQKAIKLYDKVVKREPLNNRAKLKLAESYFRNNDTENAELWYGEIINKNDLVKSIHHLHYAQILQSNGDFEQSLRWAKKYLGSNPRSEVGQNLVYGLQNVGRYFQDSSKYLVKTVNINTNAAEFAPAFYGNGLVFSSSRSNKINLKKNYAWDRSKFLDLYQTEPLIGQEMLTTPVKLKGKVNTRLHEGPATFLLDDSKIIFTRNNIIKKNEQEVNNLNLFTALLASGSDQWKDLESLPFNSKNYSAGHPTMDHSGSMLYFVSDMPGGQGGTDLYKVVYVRGKWGVPQNLGPGINSPGNEMFPFIDDNNKLYFASNGHPGLGGLDIFYVDVEDQHPVVSNAGYPLNSTKDDFGLIINVNDRSGYFSSNRGGNDDIYQFTENVGLIDVLVTNEDKVPLEASEVTIKSRGYTLDTRITDSQGNVTFEAAPQSQVELSARAQGYLEGSASLTANDTQQGVILTMVSEKPPPAKGTLLIVDEIKGKRAYVVTEEKLIEIKDDPDSSQGSWLGGLIQSNNIIIEDTVSISPIHYKFDQSEFESQYEPELEKLANLMNKYSFIDFELSSHTDSRGSDEYNLQLSRKRAFTTRDYLVNKGVSQERLLAMGHGESLPVNECVDRSPCNNTQYSKNRRTEFRLIYMDENQVVSNY